MCQIRLGQQHFTFIKKQQFVRKAFGQTLIYCGSYSGFHLTPTKLMLCCPSYSTDKLLKAFFYPDNLQSAGYKVLKIINKNRWQ